ncbi:UNVERIFIED_CONTAM: hypothetical protein Slati_2964900 [Sesamum latifolium]|uniref:Endonuclease/exonuclease/phosphatase n=1 Tax=Sesamum latifolium TaxID=2727402 RepID=A0AAW2VJJ0_9LAMI
MSLSNSRDRDMAKPARGKDIFGNFELSKGSEISPLSQAARRGKERICSSEPTEKSDEEINSNVDCPRLNPERIISNPTIANLVSTQPSNMSRQAAPRPSNDIKLENLQIPSYSSRCEGKSGGLILLWRKDANLVIQLFSSGHIDTSIASKTGEVGWRFTGIYGQPNAARRGETWQLLRKLSRLSSGSWVCAGDFNEIMRQEKKSGKLMTVVPD